MACAMPRDKVEQSKRAKAEHGKRDTVRKRSTEAMKHRGCNRSQNCSDAYRSSATLSDESSDSWPMRIARL